MANLSPFSAKYVMKHIFGYNFGRALTHPNIFGTTFVSSISRRSDAPHSATQCSHAGRLTPTHNINIKK